MSSAFAKNITLRSISDDNEDLICRINHVIKLEYLSHRNALAASLKGIIDCISLISIGRLFQR